MFRKGDESYTVVEAVFKKLKEWLLVAFVAVV